MNIQELAQKADDEADRLINMPGECHPDRHNVRDSIFAALVLEEAAKVCDEAAERSYRARKASKTVKATDIYASTEIRAMWLAAAIRALKGAKE